MSQQEEERKLIIALFDSNARNFELKDNFLKQERKADLFEMQYLNSLKTIRSVRAVNKVFFIMIIASFSLCLFTLLIK